VQNELALLRRARSFDQEALTQIHDHYYDAIFRYISFRVGDVQSVEDLTSEVFTRFLRSLNGKNAPRKTIRGWLFGTASRVVKEYYRREGRATMTPLNDTITNGAPDLASKAQINMDKAWLRQALADLTNDQQHVLALRFGYGLAIKEVAELMSKSEGSIKMLQARAIAALSRKRSRMEVGR
jgi:RNA polymerase sigma-70 factor (ECF subfamily)